VIPSTSASPNPRLQRSRAALLLKSVMGERSSSGGGRRAPLSRRPLGARILVVGLSLVLLIACSRPKTQDTSGPVAKVHVQADGTILLNGQPTSLEKLKTELDTLKGQGGTVWYSRANPLGDPPPHAMEVMEAIANAGMPVRLMEKPE